jgi:4-hydroxy-2-oxoglutarate aldolase
MMGNTGEDFQILAGSAGFLLGALSVGAVGAVSALANIAGRELVSLISAFQEGDLETARAIQIRLIEPNAAVTTRFGVPGLKAALDMIGFYGGPARLPLLPLSDAEKAELGEILAKANLI